MASFETNVAYQMDELQAQSRFEVSTNRRPILSKKFAVKSLALVVVIAALSAVWVNSFARLTVATAEVTQLTSQHAELESENNKLQVQLQTRLSSGEIRDKAVNEYAMSTLSRSQVSYLCLDGEDKAVIVEEKEDGFLSALVKKVLYVFEYLG